MSTSETSTTSLEEKCEILAQVWLDESENPFFATMMRMFSLHFSFSLLIAYDFAEATDKGETLINELWDLLIGETVTDAPETIRTFDDLKFWAKEGIFTEE